LVISGADIPDSLPHLAKKNSHSEIARYLIGKLDKPNAYTKGAVEGGLGVGSNSQILPPEIRRKIGSFLGVITGGSSMARTSKAAVEAARESEKEDRKKNNFKPK
jgi:hypothetical protein